MNLFEKATKNKFRYPSTKGELNTEDLWSLPLTSERGVSLNEVAGTLYKEMQKGTTIDFVGNSTPSDQEMKDKFSIVMQIIDSKKVENEHKRQAVARIEQRQKLLGALDAKKEESLKNMSVEELEAELVRLG